MAISRDLTSFDVAGVPGLKVGVSVTPKKKGHFLAVVESSLALHRVLSSMLVYSDGPVVLGYPNLEFPDSVCQEIYNTVQQVSIKVLEYVSEKLNTDELSVFLTYAIPGGLQAQGSYEFDRSTLEEVYPLELDEDASPLEYELVTVVNAIQHLMPPALEVVRDGR